MKTDITQIILQKLTTGEIFEVLEEVDKASAKTASEAAAAAAALQKKTNKKAKSASAADNDDAETSTTSSSLTFSKLEQVALALKEQNAHEFEKILENDTRFTDSHKQKIKTALESGLKKQTKIREERKLKFINLANEKIREKKEQFMRANISKTSERSSSAAAGGSTITGLRFSSVVNANFAKNAAAASSAAAAKRNVNKTARMSAAERSGAPLDDDGRLSQVEMLGDQGASAEDLELLKNRRMTRNELRRLLDHVKTTTTTASGRKKNKGPAGATRDSAAEKQEEGNAGEEEATLDDAQAVVDPSTRQTVKQSLKQVIDQKFIQQQKKADETRKSYLLKNQKDEQIQQLDDSSALNRASAYLSRKIGLRLRGRSAEQYASEFMDETDVALRRLQRDLHYLNVEEFLERFSELQHVVTTLKEAKEGNTSSTAGPGVDENENTTKKKRYPFEKDLYAPELQDRLAEVREDIVELAKVGNLKMIQNHVSSLKLLLVGVKEQSGKKFEENKTQATGAPGDEQPSAEEPQFLKVPDVGPRTMPVPPQVAEDRAGRTQQQASVLSAAGAAGATRTTVDTEQLGALLSFLDKIILPSETRKAGRSVLMLQQRGNLIGNQDAEGDAEEFDMTMDQGISMTDIGTTSVQKSADGSSASPRGAPSGQGDNAFGGSGSAAAGDGTTTKDDTKTSRNSKRTSKRSSKNSLKKRSSKNSDSEDEEEDSDDDDLSGTEDEDSSDENAL
ncbi:unnamed protein product [Amoebophrya sp. A120]|nr:unnamed protein product [Amoebophrya sp. A120]|eukprot:GSA120T00021756001.1